MWLLLGLVLLLDVLQEGGALVGGLQGAGRPTAPTSSTQPSASTSRAIEQLVKKRLGLSGLKEAKGLVAKYCVRGRDPNLDAAKMEATFLALEQRLTLTKPQLRRLISKWPRVLGADFVVDLEPKLFFLETRLGLETSDLRKIVLGRPQSLANSVEGNLKPKLSYLETRLGLGKEQLRKLVVSYPAVLGMAVETNLEPTLLFYEKALKLEKVGPFISSFPSSLGRSVQKRLLPRLQSAEKAGLTSDRALLNRIMLSTDDHFQRWLSQGPTKDNRAFTTGHIWQPRHHARVAPIRRIARAIRQYPAATNQTTPIKQHDRQAMLLKVLSGEEEPTSPNRPLIDRLTLLLKKEEPTSPNRPLIDRLLKELSAKDLDYDATNP